MKKPNCKASHRAKKDIIAHRKKCKASGTGLSHYVLEKK
ncbi:modified peptide precursor CbpA [bacterium]|nr:modified peptide precursor CbpA [bacterium]MBU4310290.1 modified peptide precursor CbpA [bacterium]MBU4560992.1 modified peptide precursor CbpA [bacterium]MCG2677193.1 modified peptide precursor CbpA [bacterium]